MSTTSTMNGKPPRKQLADQLDRLDSIIDALSEGLNGAVADACREGTRLALKDAIVEILSCRVRRRRRHAVRFIPLVPGYLAELVIWATAVYGFLDLPAARATVLMGYLAAASVVTRLVVLGVFGVLCTRLVPHRIFIGGRLTWLTSSPP